MHHIKLIKFVDSNKYIAIIILIIIVVILILILIIIIIIFMYFRILCRVFCAVVQRVAATGPRRSAPPSAPAASSTSKSAEKRRSPSLLPRLPLSRHFYHAILKLHTRPHTPRLEGAGMLTAVSVPPSSLLSILSYTYKSLEN